jgi:hypothetical protein
VLQQAWTQQCKPHKLVRPIKHDIGFAAADNKAAAERWLSCLDGLGLRVLTSKGSAGGQQDSSGNAGRRQLDGRLQDRYAGSGSLMRACAARTAIRGCSSAMPSHARAAEPRGTLYCSRNSMAGIKTTGSACLRTCCQHRTAAFTLCRIQHKQKVVADVNACCCCSGGRPLQQIVSYQSP